jgi:hypothetical protein
MPLHRRGAEGVHTHLTRLAGREHRQLVHVGVVWQAHRHVGRHGTCAGEHLEAVHRLQAVDVVCAIIVFRVLIGDAPGRRQKDAVHLQLAVVREELHERAVNELHALSDLRKGSHGQECERSVLRDAERSVELPCGSWWLLWTLAIR